MENQPQSPQGGQISTVQVLAEIQKSATTGWNIMTTICLTRTMLDREGASEEARRKMLDWWAETYVDKNIEKWKQKIDNPESRMAAMNRGGSLDQLIQRLNQLGDEIRSQFGTFILNGVRDPVESFGEAVDRFTALQGQASDQAQRVESGGGAEEGQ